MAGKEESDDDDGSSASSHTPELQRRRQASLSSQDSRRTDDGDVSISIHLPPLGSPSISPVMSPLSPLRRRFSRSSSPSSPLYPQSDQDEEDTTQNSRDVLAQRLNDLATRLSQESHVEDESISFLHAKINELESLFHPPEKHPLETKTGHSTPRPGNLGDDQHGSDLSWIAPDPADLLPSDASSFSSPARLSPSAKQRVGRQVGTNAEPRLSRMTVAQVEQVIVEAHNLHKDLETVISNLRDRQEETEHIHALLITRLERAAQRIIYLEERVNDLERERKGSETEILNLQIQLKAIEVQCLSYVPPGADQDLRESIDAWKLEWSALKQQRARNREQLYASPTKRGADPTAD